MMSAKSLLLGLSSFFVSLSMQAQPPAHTAHFSPYIDYNVNGFWEYLPRNYSTDVNTKYPLLVFFHGAGEQGSTQDAATINLVLRNGPPRIINNGNFPDSFFMGSKWFKFIVISPQIKNGIIGVTSTIQPSTVEAVIQYAINTYRVDATRIYLCGLSMGGGAVWDYAGSSLGAANKLAGIVVAAGAGDLSDEEATNIGESDLPVIATHNLNDPVINANRTQTNIAALNAIAPTPLPKAVYWNTGGHNVWSRTFENIIPGTSVNGNLADTLGMNVYQWMLQYFRASTVLPVVWSSFNVHAQNGKALLQWAVSTQVNTKEYLVERSKDGAQWSVVTSVVASQNMQYNFTDASLNTGIVYYRIKQVDNDGKFTYSSIKKINFDAAAKLFTYPNPFSNEIHVETDHAGKLTIRVTDLSGKIVVDRKEHVSNGELIIKNMNGLSSGMYYLTVDDAGGTRLFTGKLVKK